MEMRTFEEFDLKKELIDKLNKINFTSPTEVQEKSIPMALDGMDLVVRSKSGTGKTGAFIVPTIQKLGTRDVIGAMVVVPTRELAIQVFNLVQQLTSKSGVKGILVYGGASIRNQIDALRQSPNIIVGTPGRIIDLMKRGELRINHTKILVMDEADVMLDMGFIDDMEYIMSKMPKEKQIMLFSATVPERLTKLSQKYMRHPHYLNISKDQELTVSSISHKYAMSKPSAKLETLLTYINEYKPRKSIIFSDTKRNADYLYNALIRQGYRATVMHGDLRQSQREKALEEFRRGAQFLVATNVAARGLDITGISNVINYDIPSEPFVYVHRVGRSARMGADGAAFSIVIPNDMVLIREIERSAKISMKCIELDKQINQKVSLQIADYRSISSPGRNEHVYNKLDYSGSGNRRKNTQTKRFSGRQEHRSRSGNLHRWHD